MKIINIRMIIFAINKLNVSVYKFFYHNLFSQIKISRHDASAQKVREEQFCCSTQHMVRMISSPCAWSGRVLRTAVSRVRLIEDVAKIIRADTRVLWEANKKLKFVILLSELHITLLFGFFAFDQAKPEVNFRIKLNKRKAKNTRTRGRVGTSPLSLANLPIGSVAITVRMRITISREQ